MGFGENHGSCDPGLFAALLLELVEIRAEWGETGVATSGFAQSL
jgi:hypothetical protein